MPPNAISSSRPSQGLGISYSTSTPSLNGVTAPFGAGSQAKIPHPLSQSHTQPVDQQHYHRPFPQTQSVYQSQQYQPYYPVPDFHSNQIQPQSVPRREASGFGMDQRHDQQFGGYGWHEGGQGPSGSQGPTQQHQRNVQQGFVLRATHKRSGSKSFTSFSALPPVEVEPPSEMSQQVLSNDSVSRRSDTDSYPPDDLPIRRLPPPPPGAKDSLSSIGTSVSQRFPQFTSDPRPSTSRAGSTASLSTFASASSKSVLKCKSSDLLRRFSKNSDSPEGRYPQLPGYDDLKPLIPDEEAIEEVEMDQRYAPEGPGSPEVPLESHAETTPKPASRPLPRQPSSSSLEHEKEITPPMLAPAINDAADQHPQIESPPQRASSRASATSSSAATASRSQVDTPGDKSSHSSHAFNPRSFPAPPMQPVRSATALSDPTHLSLYQPRSRPKPQFMPRSQSQPLHLLSVAETDQEMLSASSSLLDHENRRASQISTGIHSKNAVLLSAENGGMMLAFSPSGDATWREGEPIYDARVGMVPTPETIPAPFVPGASRSRRSFERVEQSSEDRHNELRSRPWSNSTIGGDPIGPSAPFLTAHHRRHSDGAGILARQGTLFYPSTSNKRASQELGVMLGGRSRRLSANQLLAPPGTGGWETSGERSDKVRLEASKKRKARVEVDVVLERECVVEGGEVRGRMEVRVTGGKRSEGLRVGGGKIRIVGFEEISSSSRHIFYHHPYPLPLFERSASPDGPRSSLFASPPDHEGYHLAAEGSHSIPFRMRLPINGGAKGAYTAPNGKTPCVRYVVVGSIKIHVPSSGKRSIAHFYRQIVVLPYLNPAVLLAPAPEPIEARIEKGLGWSLGGEKGRVELRVGLGRRTWVSGQRIWCEIAIHNSSNKKIKSLALAILQTVQTFHPEPALETSENRISRSSVERENDMGMPDADACQTSTSRRKINEEVMEAEFAQKGAGRVTGKAWWTGVEPGESGHWDMSVLVPPGMLSIRRTRLIEVVYNLRVTVNGSIYVDIPINLINFLSIDPPPMPRDGPRLLMPMGLSANVLGSNGLQIEGPSHSRPELNHMKSSETMESINPAKASSTTLHLDALLVAGRARAEAEGRGTESAKVRPTSMMSEYTSDPLASVEVTSGRPGHTRMRSYHSGRSAETGESAGGASSEGHGDEDEDDKALMAARRARGRQRSLAVINRAIDRAREEEDQAVEKAEAAREAERIGLASMSPMEEEFKPLATPAEVAMPIVGGVPIESADDALTPRTVATSGMESQKTDSGDSSSIIHVEEMRDDEIEVAEQTNEVLPTVVEGTKVEEEEDVGDQTILDELVPHHSHQAQDGYPEISLLGEYGGYDYAEEVEDGEEGEQTPVKVRQPRISDQSQLSPRRRQSLPRQLPHLDIDPRLSIGGFDNLSERDAHIRATRSINGSFAVSTLSENESEMGQVVQAIKRNVSIKTPSHLVALSNGEELREGRKAEQPTSPRKHETNFGSSPKHGGKGYLSVNSIASGRRPSVALDVSPSKSASRDGSVSSRGGSASRRGSGLGAYGMAMRRESSNPPISSPLRAAISPPTTYKSMSDDEFSSSVGARVVQKKPSFSFATPGSPIRARTSSIAKSPVSPGVSPRSAYPGQMQVSPIPVPSVSPGGESMARLPSVNGSSLKHEMRPALPSPTLEQGPNRSPGLAPSVASDSASSEGQLESPPVAQFPMTDLPALPTKGVSAFEYSGLKHAAVSPDWSPSDDLLTTQVHYLQTDPNATFERRGGHNRLRSIASCVSSDDNHSTTTHETTTSILPSVKTKIAQLETRDEALRKFSLASIASSYVSPRASIPTYTPPPPVKSPSGRKSYTAALAPRAPRLSTAKPRPDDQLGGTTYIRPRVHRESKIDMEGHLDPFGLGLKRGTSISSTSTSATALDAALGRKWGKQGGSSPGQVWSPRSRELPRIPSARVSEDTDESEGLL